MVGEMDREELIAEIESGAEPTYFLFSRSRTESSTRAASVTSSPRSSSWKDPKTASTADRVLVEASPRDRIWGIGLGRNSDDATNPRRWRGQNLLGFALMEVPAKLREG